MDSAKPLPHDLDAERSVLGAILIDNSTYSVADQIVQPLDFFRKAHRIVFECIGGILGDGRVADFVTVKESLERNGLLDEVGGFAFIASLTDGVPRSVNIEAYAKIVREKARQRKIVTLGQQLQASAWNEEYEAAEVAQNAINGLSVIGDDHGSRARAVLVNMGDVVARPISWLWYRRIAFGKLSMLAGDPGVGKSYLTMDLVARVTTGRAWPDGEHGPQPIHVVLLAAEDDAEDTIKPRLVARGADCSRVTSISMVRERGRDDRMLQLSTDIGVIEDAIITTGARLVIIDPLNAYLGTGVDAYRDNEVRGILAPLIAAAAKHQCAMLGVMHLSKDSTKAAQYRPGGSVAFVGAPRVVMMVVPDAENPARRVLAVAKENNGPADPLAYSVNKATGELVWESSPVEGFDLNSHLAAAGASGSRDKAEETDAVQVIKDLLEDASKWPLPVADALAAGKACGVGERALQRARKALGIRVSKLSGFSAAGKWIWHLPNPDSNPARDTDVSGMSGMEKHAVNGGSLPNPDIQSPFTRARETRVTEGGKAHVEV